MSEYQAGVEPLTVAGTYEHISNVFESCAGSRTPAEVHAVRFEEAPRTALRQLGYAALMQLTPWPALPRTRAVAWNLRPLRPEDTIEWSYDPANEKIGLILAEYGGFYNAVKRGVVLATLSPRKLEYEWSSPRQLYVPSEMEHGLNRADVDEPCGWSPLFIPERVLASDEEGTQSQLQTLHTVFSLSIAYQAMKDRCFGSYKVARKNKQDPEDLKNKYREEFYTDRRKIVGSARV